MMQSNSFLDLLIWMLIGTIGLAMVLGGFAEVSAAFLNVPLGY